MLCCACQKIFESPRRLAYGSIEPWRQTPESFRRSLVEGCHLCSLVQENRSYNNYRSPQFPRNVNYAFKPLNPEWARSGSTFKWYAYQQSSDDDDDNDSQLEDFRQGILEDPTPNQLGTLLATDAPNLVKEAAKSWIVLEFFGDEQVLLPVEICTNDPLEQLAQSNLDSQSRTGQPETLQLARTWVQNCIHSHPPCQPQKSEAWLPTRLIDVGTAESPVLRLVSNAHVDPNAPYVALSHRWGANQAFILRSQQVAPYQETIPDSEVSRTVQDAAVVTRALGVRYLWVDCMCIIQDDDGQDWARESNTMFKVYSLSTCTIAAANSGDGEGGFLVNRDQYRVRPCHVPSPFKKGSKHSFKIMSQYLNKIHDMHVRNTEWFNRGWVFQERMLAPRLLIFTKAQVLWGCAKLQAAETWPSGKTNDNFIDRFNSVEVEKARLNDLVHKDLGISKTHDSWWEFLQDYMSSKLTVLSDRLVAIRGVAALVEGLTGERHCAGMWLTDDLPNALLWHVRGETQLRSGAYLAPSFSWAAIRGCNVEFARKRLGIEETLVSVLEATHLKSNLLFSNMKNNREALRLSGRLLSCSVVTSPSGLSIDFVMTREEGEKEVERIKIEVEEAAREAAKVKAAEEADERWASLRKHPDKPAPFHVSGNRNFNANAKQWPEVIASYKKTLKQLSLLGGGSHAGTEIKAKIKTFARSTLERLHREPQQAANDKASQEGLPTYFYEAEMKRRQRVAEKRAERVFADLARGVKFEEPVRIRKVGGVDGEKNGHVTVLTYTDFVMPKREVLEVFFLPLLRSGDTASGLIVRPKIGRSGHYERIGMFSDAPQKELAKLPRPAESEEFLLV